MTEAAAGEWADFFFRRMAGGKGRGRHLAPEDLARLAALRHARGAPFGGGPFGGPFGGGRGRKRRGDVRVALLLLLAEEPRNGYQLMQTIEERSGGRWRPSPGAVYPALSQLEDEGLIRATERDGTRVFEITDAGRDSVGERGDMPAPWDHGEEDENPAAKLRGLIGGIGQATIQVAQAGTEHQIEKASRLLKETRRELYRILAEDDEA